MEIDAAIVAVQKRFAGNFSTYPIAFPNEPPNVKQDPFVRFSAQVGPTNPSLDSGYERTTGVIFLSALVPKGMGDVLAWQIARLAARVLAYKTFDGVRCTSAEYTSVGELGDALVQDAGWYQVNASIPFWFENYPVNN